MLNSIWKFQKKNSLIAAKKLEKLIENYLKPFRAIISSHLVSLK